MILKKKISAAFAALMCFTAASAFDFAPAQKDDYRLKYVDFGVHAEAGAYPNNHGNSSGRGNGAVLMERENPNLNLNQAWFWIGRDADISTNAFDWGVRFDIAYGTDHIAMASSGGDYVDANGNYHSPWDGTWTRAEGNAPVAGRYGLAIPQLYVQASWYQWRLTLGHFFGTAGYESLTAPDTDFYSNSILFNYPPSTLTGVKVERSFGKVDTYAGYSNGINTSFRNEFNDYYFIGGVNYNFSDTMSLAYNFIGGSQDNSTVDKNRSEMVDEFNYFHNILFIWNAAQKLRLVTDAGYNYSHGYDSASGNEKVISRTFGFAQYVMYDISDKFTAAARFDALQARAGGASHNMYSVTANLTYNLCEYIMIRPEARYGWSTEKLYNDAADKEQLNGGVSVIVKF